VFLRITGGGGLGRSNLESIHSIARNGDTGHGNQDVTEKVQSLSLRYICVTDQQKRITLGGAKTASSRKKEHKLKSLIWGKKDLR